MSNLDKAVQLRYEYASCVKLANETDSKKEDAHLRAEAKTLLEQLRQECPHAHIVCLHSEYEGSSSMDYDDGHAEKRICLCCGLREDAYRGDWKQLTATPFIRFENDALEQVKEPLRYLLSEAMQIAEEKGYRYFGRYSLRD